MPDLGSVLPLEPRHRATDGAPEWIPAKEAVANEKLLPPAAEHDPTPGPKDARAGAFIPSGQRVPNALSPTEHAVDRKLICRIEVVTKTGQGPLIGTGYVVARDRILTAAHVVKDAETMDFYFGEKNEQLQLASPPTVRWNGLTDHHGDQPVDVAVMKATLPDELRPPEPHLARGHVDRVDYEGCGFSAAIRTSMDNGMFDFHGSLPSLTGQSHQVVTTSYEGPNPEEFADVDQTWGGVSGSSLFEVGGKRRLLAVATDFVPDNHHPTIRAVPLPYLLNDPGFRAAVRFHDVSDVIQQSRQRIKSLAQSCLARSKVTCRFILACNELPTDTTPEQLANQMFDGECAPMQYLRNCVMEPEHKPESAGELRELGKAMCLLVSLAAPVCSGVDDIESLQRHLGAGANSASIGTRERDIAKSRVAFVKQLSANFDHDDTWAWEKLGPANHPDAKRTVASFPAPPAGSSGLCEPLNEQQIIETFAKGLYPLLNARSRDPEDVDAALSRRASQHEIYFCILFATRQHPEILRYVHEAFPDLILLEPREESLGRDVRREQKQLLDDIHQIRTEFCPDKKAIS